MEKHHINSEGERGFKDSPIQTSGFIDEKAKAQSMGAVFPRSSRQHLSWDQRLQSSHSIQHSPFCPSSKYLGAA